MESHFELPVGLIWEGQAVTKLPIAETGGEAEKIFTKKPASSKLHTWFGQVISCAVTHIGNTPISSEFLKPDYDANIVPDAVKALSFIDVGTLMLQIQRTCWEKTIKDQKLQCVNCGEKLNADIELDKIPVPVNAEDKPITEFSIKLSKTYTINGMVEQMKEYEGQKFNHIKFRVATLGDAIKHQEIARDEILFWRRIAFDTIVGFYYQENDNSPIEEVSEGYLNKRGLKLFNSDFTTSTLKEIRAGLQKTLPSAKFYYEEECPMCNKQTPFFASVTNFFST